MVQLVADIMDNHVIIVKADMAIVEDIEDTKDIKAIKAIAITDIVDIKDTIIPPG